MLLTMRDIFDFYFQNIFNIILEIMKQVFHHEMSAFYLTILQ